MKYEFISNHRSASRVEKMCQALKVSRSGYYGWAGREPSQRDEANRQLLVKIKRSYDSSRQTYGSPRITVDLRESGETCNQKRVARLMKINGLIAKTKRRFKITTNTTHNHLAAPNLVNQEFFAQRPGQLWTSDITYLPTKAGWLYLAVVLDVYNRQIVGWAMSKHLNRELVIISLKQALNRQTPSEKMIFHSDRGSQYTSAEFRKLLNNHAILASNSGKGNCYDNAITETFFHTLKTELVYFENYQTREEARLSIFEYIEVFYNRKRRHSALGYKSPVDFLNQENYLNHVSEK
jgi:transposase InsO family protein